MTIKGDTRSLDYGSYLDCMQVLQAFGVDLQVLWHS